MENTSLNIARDLLARCLAGEVPPVPDALLDEAGSPAFFRVVVEGLADRFDPALCDVYAALFSQALARTMPSLDAGDLRARYDRVRSPHPFGGDAARVETVFVLSRVTLGADVAITSVLLDAAKKRFPRARIVFAGGRKAWELFAGDPRIEHLAAAYPRDGALAERLAPWPELQRHLSAANSITIDPDSRLTQLGLLPVCPEENYYFFESRCAGGDSDDSLGVLTRRWAAQIFGIDDARAFIAPASAFPAPAPDVTVSFGVGENAAKRIVDPFEERLLRALAERAAHVYIDKGAGGEETERVERAIDRACAPPGRIGFWQGAFAPFAAAIARSRLYVGYDSAGQHVAAACGVPLVSIFAGFPTARMAARWRPTGPGAVEVIRVEDPDPESILGETLLAVNRLQSAGV